MFSSFNWLARASLITASSLLLAACGGGGGGESSAGSPAKAQSETQNAESVVRVGSSATLSWKAPWTRENGVSLDMGEIDQYVVRYGLEENVQDMSEEVTIDGQDMEYQIAGLGDGTWHFAIRTVDDNGLESAWSEVVSKTIAR
jgi:hypothetical protein